MIYLIPSLPFVNHSLQSPLHHHSLPTSRASLHGPEAYFYLRLWKSENRFLAGPRLLHPAATVVDGAVGLYQDGYHQGALLDLCRMHAAVGVLHCLILFIICPQ